MSRREKEHQYLSLNLQVVLGNIFHLAQMACKDIGGTVRLICWMELHMAHTDN